MKTDLKSDVAKPDDSHRRALEEVIGCGLESRQRLIISVVDLAFPRTQYLRPAQTLLEHSHGHATDSRTARKTARAWRQADAGC